MVNGRLVASDAYSSDAQENEAEYIVTRDGLSDVNDAAQRQIGRLNDDASERNEATKAEKNENSDWPDLAVYSKINLCRSCRKVRKTMPNFWMKNHVMKTMHKVLQKRG